MRGLAGAALGLALLAAPAAACGTAETACAVSGSFGTGEYRLALPEAAGGALTPQRTAGPRPPQGAAGTAPEGATDPGPPEGAAGALRPEGAPPAEGARPLLPVVVVLHGWGGLFTHMTPIPEEWSIYPHAQSAQTHRFPHGRKISSHQNMEWCFVMRPVLDRAVGGAIQKGNGP